MEIITDRTLDTRALKAIFGEHHTGLFRLMNLKAR